MFETIIFEKKDNVAWIRFNRPSELNSFTKKMHKEIIQSLKEVKKNEQIRAVILTGEGRAFSAGQDLKDVQEKLDYGDYLRETYNPLILEIVSLEKPVIAAVNGVAAGAGFSLALACDFRLVSSRAKFIEAFINVGLVPDSGHLFFLPRIIGYAKALELAALGGELSAEEATKIGLVTKLVPHETFEEEVHSFAKHISSMPTKTIGLIKKQMHESFHSNLSQMLEGEAYAQQIAGKTEDHREGIAAFLEKRKPNFKGK
ncbi:enoyl-CoA hydratase-related protein [Fervidibacillus halotolerans]|uniref:Enoyl-CoA hydratase-related protein n=1 Tax=Fervidibacillus halotolerans TaxID=2980027 RepID=A0A9E8RY46_9BACI|nr:enoyl-CoA hydratase-related protein [Fervidibacillus halotolerans]WAA11849.1 enoyl-CoA hydratase-related protein [Fervidibacillus halotolerans]